LISSTDSSKIPTKSVIGNDNDFSAPQILLSRSPELAANAPFLRHSLRRAMAMPKGQNPQFETSTAQVWLSNKLVLQFGFVLFRDP
jgi:hypothetical protein